jgi:maltose-binding protein MalE
MPNSLDAFLAGQVGFIFGYNYHLPIIKSRAPRLNLGIAPIPQVNPEAPENYASYWVEGVSQKSSYQNEAWDFILFATQKNQVKKYLEKTQRPTALKSLINEQIENENLHAAATQILTAKNWYRGQDALAAETAIKDMLEELLNSPSEKESKHIMQNTTQKINQTIQ